MQSNRVDFIRKHVTRNLYKNCIRVCVSERLADEYKKFFGLSCHTIPLPLRISSSNPRGFEERDDSVLHIGTRPVKNLETSINTCKELMKNKIHVKLIVAGAWKDYAERLVENARNSGIDVETKYDFEARELGHLYSRAKALILPSKYEALPYVTLESMTNGTPVVVSQAIPSEVVIENFNGFRIDTSNPADYARAIAMLMKDPILWTRLSQNASRSVRRYDHVGVAKQYVELIEKSRAERTKRHGLEPRVETVPNN
jgi:glycosyltransferase involved in cell wall biosynthesis